MDLVELKGLQTHLYEIKYSYTPSSQFFKGIQSFRENAPEQRKEGKNYVIFAGEEIQIRTIATLTSWLQLPEL